MASVGLRARIPNRVLRTAVVLIVGVPLVLICLGFYGFRKWLFGIPVHGDWNMEDVRNRLHSRKGSPRKGPNSWN